MDDLNLDLNNREIRGKKVANLRRSGITPVHLYGDNTNSLSLQCDTQTLNKIIPEAGRNIPIHVTLPGEDNASVCFVREVQHHPVTDEIIHVDFLKVNVSSTVRTEVPVTVDGVSPAVRNLGGTLLQPLQVVTVEALPMSIPAGFTLSAELLVDFDINLYVKDIEVPSGVTMISDPEEMVATAVPPRVESEHEAEGVDQGLLAEETGEETELEDQEE